MIRDYRQLRYHTIIIECVKIVNQWRDKSDNKDLTVLADGLMELITYVSSLELERKGYDDVVNEQQTIVHRKDKEIAELKEEIADIRRTVRLERS